MWTPRRILLLVAGAVALSAVFAIYNRFLGWIDGLPALPEKYLPSSNPEQLVIDLPSSDSFIDRKLQRAFGEGCRETGYRYRISLHTQGMYLASGDIKIEPDGRLKMMPFSLAVFGKENAETQFPEISTFHCDVAYATFDRKVESFSDMAKSKIVAAEFIADETAPGMDRRKGLIYVVHNHATPQPDDDIVMQTRGPFYYRDTAGRNSDQPQLWTRAFVDITDYQSRPNHIIKAQGMNIYLESDASVAGKSVPVRSDDNWSRQVHAIEMMKVEMTLTLEGDSSFVGGDRSAPAKKVIMPKDKARLWIHTLGRFRFDLPKNRAQFDVAPPQEGDIPRHVEVIRSARRYGNDTLQCEHLEVQFRQKLGAKPGAAPPAAPGPAGARPVADVGSGTEIDEIRATGQVVVLTSESEKLHARGHEVIYSQAQRRSILRGAPTVVVRDGNKIQSSELVLHQMDGSTVPLDPDQSIPQARAKGPGMAWIVDRENQRTIQVQWNREMKLDRERDADRLTLTGGARFEDGGHQQWLEGEQIKLWLSPDSAREPLARPEAAPAGVSAGRSKPRRVHVLGRVVARTPDLEIRNTDEFVVWFQDVPSLPGLDLRPGTAPGQLRIAESPVRVPVPVLPLPSPPSGAAGSAKPSTSNPARKPIVVSARTVEAFVLRAAARNELDRVKCQERVHVHQDAPRPEERGLDLHSQTLDLVHTAEGDIVTLTGTGAVRARVETQQLTLAGPQIVFDQKENLAKVFGAGNMRLMSASALTGDTRARSTPIDVYWNEKMHFLGSIVSFYGGVQAQQDNAMIRCPKMDVHLDRVVSLGQMHRERLAAIQPPSSRPAVANSDEPARVKKVICHRDGQASAAAVSIHERVVKDGKLVRQQQIVAPEVSFYNDESRIRVAGPGEVRLLQWGEKGTADPLGKPTATASQPMEAELKLTSVRFRGWMDGNTKTQTVKFFTNIRVFHTPANDIKMAIDDNKVLPGAFSLRCDRLTVDSNEVDGRSATRLAAEGHADVQALEFSGRADTIKYDDGAGKKQQVIFDSTGGSSPAALYHVAAPGQKPRELLGQTIFYWRQTNQFKVFKAVGLSGQD